MTERSGEGGRVAETERKLSMEKTGVNYIHMYSCTAVRFTDIKQNFEFLNSVLIMQSVLMVGLTYC